MPIRNAWAADCSIIKDLLDQLGYEYPVEIIKERLEKLLESESDEVFVYTENGKVEAFITLHYSLQLAFDGDFCEIGYFVVDSSTRGKGIGKQMEEFAYQTAKNKGCSSINVFSRETRTDAHRFYERQGYKEARKFFAKGINH
ncbi:GNAT family N-acetyltransferase [Dysgonomonas macrotermitis]|uniref:N-acetylglutamate synthase, GNAT family n=1 Tax=Dysgonomonas macrotermitis TaxID=1346286 RepID=A0A1M5HGB4_9BACT|nr:GNAT family N-acetyltransferase [Dysgonomonas macrotermitis]SHG15006.1 N-acetylglutamate synthase, GNAT family [Dysgonomonas macrotermitis]